MNILPLNVSCVIDVCKKAKHPLTARTIAKKLGIKPKHAKAALYQAKNYVDKNVVLTLRTELNVRRKRPIWSYVSAL